MSATGKIVLAVLAVLWMPVAGHGQAAGEKAPSQNEARHPDFAPLKALIGQWSGHGAGQPGNSDVQRSYRIGVGGAFVVVENQSVYAPQKANPSGERHVDHSLIGYDRARKKYVMRQFHAEGFVNQYVLDEMAPDGTKLVWLTETIENISPGWRAKETYLVKSPDEFTEVFELAQPGKDFEVYTKNEFRRVNSDAQRGGR